MKNKCSDALASMPTLQNLSGVELDTAHYFPDFQPLPFELSRHIEHLRSVALAFLIAGLLAICTTLSYELWQSNPLVTAEGSLLESAQLAFLLLATLVQIGRALISRTSNLQQIVGVGLALLTFALFLRELDINKLGGGTNWDTLENVVRTIALVMILVFAWHASHRIKLIMHNIDKILLAPTILISLLACLLYACGWPFDKELINIDKSLSLWFEETLELNACLLLVCASFANSIQNERNMGDDFVSEPDLHWDVMTSSNNK